MVSDIDNRDVSRSSQVWYMFGKHPRFTICDYYHHLKLNRRLSSVVRVWFHPLENTGDFVDPNRYLFL